MNQTSEEPVVPVVYLLVVRLPSNGTLIIFGSGVAIPHGSDFFSSFEKIRKHQESTAERAYLLLAAWVAANRRESTRREKGWNFLAIETTACTVVGRGEKSLLSDSGSELLLR